jgi:signal transduction histidine kinase
VRDVPIRILLIDDDEDDALLTRELLEDAQDASGQRYTLDWKDRYATGLQTVLDRQHDLVLVDYNLQPGRGGDLIAEARAAGVRTPFVLLTSLADADIDRQVMEAGAADFLVKGDTNATLLERSIRYALRHSATLDALALRTQQLERSNLELEQFARAVSHDLRQPLHIIAGYAELLAFRYQDRLDPKAQHMMDRIVNGVERMNSMIEDLLRLSKLDAQGDEIQEVDTGAVVRQLIADFEPTIAATTARIRYPILPVLRGRRAHLEQLFRNLLGNALKFVGDDPPQIDITCSRDQLHWHFVVTDNGLGVPQQVRETIFEPFQRGTVGADIAGTGVGLALCAKIVQQHDGRIWVEPAQPTGASFHFTIGPMG